LKYPLRLNRIPTSLEFYSEVTSLIEESKQFLSSYSWCYHIKDGWLFTNLGKVLCVFLYEIDNSHSLEDNFLWVVVGDLPPIYLDTYNVLSNRDALEVYVEIVNDWIYHVETNQSLEKCFPLASDHSSESLQKLKKRTDLLQNAILPEIDELSFTMI
jgi:hypothetical protein